MIDNFEIMQGKNQSISNFPSSMVTSYNEHKEIIFKKAEYYMSRYWLAITFGRCITGKVGKSHMNIHKYALEFPLTLNNKNKLVKISKSNNSFSKNIVDKDNSGSRNYQINPKLCLYRNILIFLLLNLFVGVLNCAKINFTIPTDISEIMFSEEPYEEDSYVVPGNYKFCDFHMANHPIMINNVCQLPKKVKITQKEKRNY